MATISYLPIDHTRLASFLIKGQHIKTLPFSLVMMGNSSNGPFKLSTVEELKRIDYLCIHVEALY